MWVGDDILTPRGTLGYSCLADFHLALAWLILPAFALSWSAHHFRIRAELFGTIMEIWGMGSDGKWRLSNWYLKKAMGENFKKVQKGAP